MGGMYIHSYLFISRLINTLQYVHSFKHILRFMHVQLYMEGGTKLTLCHLHKTVISHMNTLIFGPYPVKRRLYRIRIQVRPLTKKILSRTKRKRVPYFLKNIFSYRKPQPSENGTGQYGRFLSFFNLG
jgi:hypothetical protein